MNPLPRQLAQSGPAGADVRKVTLTRAEATARAHNRRSRPHDSPDHTGGYASTEVGANRNQAHFCII